MTDRPKQVYQVFIRTTPDKLWEGITSPEFTQRYFYNTRIASDWQPGSPLVYMSPEGEQVVDGEVLEVDRPRRLVHSWHMLYDAELRGERPSRVTWEIEQLGETCRLTVVHDDFDGETKTYQTVAGGWTGVLSGLKTVLETGEPMAISRSG